MMKTKLLLMMVLFSIGVQSQNIYFPDANFKTLLLSSSSNNTIAQNLSGNYFAVDADGDGEIQVNEAKNVSQLNLQSDFVSNNKISSLVGITSFLNLKTLVCRYNKLVSLDLQGLTNLQSLDCIGNQLSSLNIQNCSNLQYLHCSENQLTSLDLQEFTNLKNLNCSYNQLASLDIQGLTNLKYLSCDGNQLSSLNVQNLPSLTELNCRANQLTTLNLNDCTNLSTLNAPSNLITSINFPSNPKLLTFVNVSKNRFSTLDVSSLTNLKLLGCGENLLTQIDITHNPRLERLLCFNNQLTEIDLSNNGNLLELYCYNNDLRSIDVSNTKVYVLTCNDNPNLKSINYKNGNFSLDYLCTDCNAGNNFTNNPSLVYFCCDEYNVNPIKNYFSALSQNNISVNTYCSFSPGGNHNTISGTAKIDTDNNGCDSADNPFEYLKLKIDDGTNSGETFVQNDGRYEFYIQQGDFSIVALAENPTLFTVSPANFSATFADNNNNIFTQDICVTANGSQNDAEVVIAPLTNARPGFDAVYNLVWRNKGNTILSGKVILNYDSNKMTFQNSSLPYSILGNGSIEFNYADLKPFANTASEITFKINTPMDSTNPVNMGDVLAFNAQITPTNTDITPEDNHFGFNHTVVNSFDPNDIVCLEGETVPVSTVGKYLHYVINFENTGNAEAENIVVKMEVDPNEFDINTLQLQNASASVDAKIVGNQVEFAFKKIKLQSGGHGNVLLKMKSKSDLVEGDTVNNMAEIYFDYNFPIETNDYVTTIYNANDVLTAKINYSASNFSQNNYPINFDASLSTGNITSYQWEFSGNSSISSSSDVKPMVIYNAPGSYTAKLTVFDSNGASSSKTITFSVGENVADLSTGKNSENNFIAIDADEDDWKGYDVNGVEITPKVRHTYTGWSNAEIGNGKNSQWITLNNLEGYYTYKSREFTIPDNATDAKLNLRSLSFVRNWTYLVKVNPDGSETETEITKTQWLNDGFKGWLNSRSPKVDNYSLSPGRYYIKVFLYSNNNMVRQSIDVNAIVFCSEGLMFANKMVQKEPTLDVGNSKNSEIQVFPTPTKGLINIISDEKINAVEVYDVAGRIVQKQMYSAASKESKININAIKGIYYLKIKTNKGDTIKKIIKE